MDCWANHCGERVGPLSRTYCEGHWKEVIEHLVAATEYIGDGAASLYIGRTNYPERRLLEHVVERGHDRLAVLHWSAHRDEIREVEEALIAYVKRKFPKKGTNMGDQSSGRKSGPWYAIYISWREKTRTEPVPVRWIKVDHLEGCPIAPMAAWLPFPVFMRTELTAGEVDLALRARYRGE